jgi:hypothetical protein
MVLETPVDSPRARWARSFIAAKGGEKYYGINAETIGPHGPFFPSRFISHPPYKGRKPGYGFS